ncbi:glucosamine-6-phosphate deaminase [Marinilactibacillus sp. Marseille-P9653]|uniref:glucosamine-6-phosphate deaminase n=1 Tax=Marinilactibacillus sp. Marseille-P9653 TaxID=2866583 RepID=UPI001CE3F527|nr:glucosamine-6-phosphate deaminase [Marinilactibacillus sp. Marseille-P9653]
MTSARQFKTKHGLNVIVVENKEQGGKKAFELIKEAMESGAKVLGLATGSTPETLYKEMRESELDYSDMISVNLDEYVGLPADHPQSYHTFMEDNLFSSKPFKKTFIPDGLGDEQEEIKRYNKIIEEYPIDLQILGIGTNAHIGFNEPGTSFLQETHMEKLTDATIESNKRYFESEEEVPKYAFSMGIKSILSAKQIVLMAYGEEKSEAIDQMINGSITEQVPASVLQTHDNVTIIIDEAAASRL